jgi:hypothetical protein
MITRTVSKAEEVKIELFSDSDWLMPLGERAALEGVLTQLKPTLSIEIGTRDRGSFERILHHSDEARSFAIARSLVPIARQEVLPADNRESRELRPALESFAAAGRNIDFVLIDGSDSSGGIRDDVEDLLNAPAISSTVILIRDTTNETIRAGLDEIAYAAWPKVAYVDLDFVPGHMMREGRVRYALRGGLGLIIVDSTRLAYRAGSVMQNRYFPAAEVFAKARDQLVGDWPPGRKQQAEPPAVNPNSALEQKFADRITELENEVLRLTSVAAHHEALWRGIMRSVSWKITAPLRFAAARARHIRGG